MERGLKAVFAMVDLFTLGMAAGGTRITELGAKEALEFTCKTVAVEFGSNVAVCGIGALGEAFDWPVPVTIMLSLATGITVSCIGNKLLFQNAEGVVIRETVLDDEKVKMIEESLEGGTTSKIGYEYLDDQLGSLKDKVKVNQYQSAESVNDWWEARGYKSPYKEKTVVQNITLTEDTKFVRVYDGVNSNLEGGWVMRAEDIKGLTSKEIQTKFALEYEPVFVGEVELKAGDTIRLGEVGPNFGFDGGGIQIDLQQQWIGDFTELGKIEEWR